MTKEERAKVAKMLRAMAACKPGEKVELTGPGPPTQPMLAEAADEIERGPVLRYMKVLVEVPGDATEGHRAVPVAIHRSKKNMIVVAATSGTGFEEGKLYRTEDRVEGHHPYVANQVLCVPATDDWEFVELAIARKVGVDPEEQIG